MVHEYASFISTKECYGHLIIDDHEYCFMYAPF